MKFLYQLDRRKFTLPWGRPSMLRLEGWYRRMLKEFEKFEPFEFYLNGGFWSNQFDQAWDVDLFLVPENSLNGDPYSSMDRKTLLWIHKIMLRGITLGIEHFRMLVDITATNEERLKQVQTQLRSFEKGETDGVAVESNVGYGIHKYVQKIQNGIKTIELKQYTYGKIDLGDGIQFHKKEFGDLGKQIENIRNGRIYYDPVKLSELFD